MAPFDILSGLLGAGATSALANYGLRETEQAGQTAATNLTNLAAQLKGDLAFRPYTVTTPTGTTQTTAAGTTLGISPELQAIQQQLQGGAANLFGVAQAPIEARATALAQQLEAAAAPERQRQYLQMENRLFQQGRGGVQSAQYGGTPEQLAFAKALEEQRAQNALMGRQQAVAEQMQAYNVGAGMLGQSFLPQQQALQALQVGVQPMELATRAQQQAAVTGAGLQQSAAEAQLQASQQANALRQIYLQEALKGLLAPQYSVTDGVVSSGSSLLGGLFSGISDLFKSNTATAPTPVAGTGVGIYG